MQPTDEELVYRCLDGDEEAFGTLVTRYERPVYATAFYYVGRYGVADDVAQEAFWAAYRGLPRLREPAKFASWLREITTRTAANWLRRNNDRLRSETPLPHRRSVRFEDVHRGPAEQLEGQELLETVQRAVDALPERYRLPVVLRFMQELSYDEISQFTGESREEVRGILFRAGRQLRELLVQERSAGQMKKAGPARKNEEGGAAWHQ